MSTTTYAKPTYSFDYTHSCYPGFEAYIGSQFVYGYKPPSNNSVYVALCLGFTVGDVIGTTSGT
ncbi:MAG: hypothetical protein WB992_14165 [Bryobacteraceae bacterium]